MTKKLLRVLDGEAIWPPPAWLMRQAGRYLPEYRAIRAQAGDFIALCTNPALAAEVTLQPIRRYGLDAAILFSDILILPWALGWGLRFAEGEGPVLPQFRSLADLDVLDPLRLANAVEPVMETLRLVRDGLGREGFGATTAVIGFAGAPFTVACYMVEGRGTKDFATARGMAFAQPDLFGALIQQLTQSTIAYLALQIEAGAETVMLFDSWAGLLSPVQFRRHVIAPTRIIVAALKARFPLVRIIGFPRMAGLLAAEYATQTGVDCIGLDSSTDPLLAAGLIPANVAVQGNLDPLAVVAGGPALPQELQPILEAFRGRPWIFNLGHGLVPQTPPEHVAELLRLVRNG